MEQSCTVTEDSVTNLALIKTSLPNKKDVAIYYCLKCEVPAINKCDLCQSIRCQSCSFPSVDRLVCLELGVRDICILCCLHKGLFRCGKCQVYAKTSTTPCCQTQLCSYCGKRPRCCDATRNNTYPGRDDGPSSDDEDVTKDPIN